MLVAMAASWPAWEQFFLVQQREAAFSPTNEFEKNEYQAILSVFNKLMNASLAAVEKGNEIITTRKDIKFK